jgi:hypothetical protein
MDYDPSSVDSCRGIPRQLEYMNKSTSSLTHLLVILQQGEIMVILAYSMEQSPSWEADQFKWL